MKNNDQTSQRDFKKVSSYFSHDQNKKHWIFSPFSVLGIIKIQRNTITSQLLTFLYLTNIGPSKKAWKLWPPALWYGFYDHIHKKCNLLMEVVQLWMSSTHSHIQTFSFKTYSLQTKKRDCHCNRECLKEHCYFNWILKKH